MEFGDDTGIGIERRIEIESHLRSSEWEIGGTAELMTPLSLMTFSAMAPWKPVFSSTFMDYKRY